MTVVIVATGVVNIRFVVVGVALSLGVDSVVFFIARAGRVSRFAPGNLRLSV